MFTAFTAARVPCAKLNEGRPRHRFAIMEQAAHASEPHASRGRRMLCALLEPLAIDMRSLAAFRIAIAIVLLVDLATRAVDLSDHYTDHGFYPRSARIALERSDAYDSEVRYQWSLHMLS